MNCPRNRPLWTAQVVATNPNPSHVLPQEKNVHITNIGDLNHLLCYSTPLTVIVSNYMCDRIAGAHTLNYGIVRGDK